MNLKRLLDMQRSLDADITIKHPAADGEDRAKKKLMALVVELGELANEWRGFKFWSTNQLPRTELLVSCPKCDGSGDGVDGYCGNCHDGHISKVNPLLNEYVDCLHFILSIGIMLDLEHVLHYEFTKVTSKKQDISNEVIADTFMKVIEYANGMYSARSKYNYMRHTELWEGIGASCLIGMFENFIALGLALGFTLVDIENEYISKNYVNLERLKNNY